MRAFEYRQPRLTTNFNIDFVVDGEIFRGQCTDLSDGGLSATFDRTLHVGDQGMLKIWLPKKHLTVTAVVAHLEEETHVGLSFLCQTPEERNVVEELAVQTGCHHPA